MKKTEHTEEEPEKKKPPKKEGKKKSKNKASRNKKVEEPLQTQLLRLQADFDNFRKRTIRERSEMYQRANEDLLMEILPVLDHFEMGLQTARDHKAEDSVTQGFKMVYDQLNGALKKFGLTPVDAEGELFDPHVHEAMTHLPSDEHPEDHVMAQTRRGYRLGEKLLRAAQVVVSSGPAAEPAPAEEDFQEGGE